MPSFTREPCLRMRLFSEAWRTLLTQPERAGAPAGAPARSQADRLKEAGLPADWSPAQLALAPVVV
eukprot:6800076-Pyramimonas_sp.AAC.1